MLRLVLRPLLVILTLGMLLVALFQVAGRVTFTLLDDLELAVNQLLSVGGIRVTGLSGDWRMLNPVLRAERVDVPAGYVAGLVLEIDMLESVLRGTPVARRLKVEDARIDLRKRWGEPWRLAGTAAGASFDPLPFLRDSSQLEFDGSVRFLRQGWAPVEMHVGYLGINRGGEHRHSARVRNHADDCAAPCSVAVDYYGREGLWPLREPQARVEMHSDGFLLPRTVLGFSPLKITRLDAAWQRQEDDAGGTLSFAAEQFDMPGDVTLAVRLEGSLRGSGEVQTGVVSEWRVERGADVWVLPEVDLLSDGSGISAWMPELDLARAGAFLSQALAGVGPAESWLQALNVRGQAYNLRLRYGFGGDGLAYAMTLGGLAVDGYKGVPTVARASGELLGYGRGLQFNLNAQNLTVAFPEVFRDSWNLPYAQGAVQAWFGADYFGIRGLNLRAEALGTRAAGSFAMTRPPDREGQRLLLLVSTDRMGVAEAKQFVPYKLPDGLRNWLDRAPRGGVLEDARIAYQGQFQDRPGELGRRLELDGHVRDAQLRYHPDWPVVTGLTGDFAVAGSLVDVVVDAGLSAGAELAGSEVRVVDNGAAVRLSLDAETTASDMLTFVRTTPLQGWLAFVEADWEGTGPMRLTGDLNVPLGTTDTEPAVRLRADLEGVDLALPGFRVAVGALNGSVRYRYPFYLDAAGVSGEMFGEQVTVAASTETVRGRERVHLRFSGRARPEDVWRLADLTDPGVADGSFDYRADLAIAVTPEGVSEISVSSPLQGLGVELPAGYAKDAAEVVPVEVRLAFPSDYRALSFAYRDATGWLHFIDTPLRGAIGFAADPGPENVSASDLELTGRVAAFALEEVIPGGDSGVGLPLPLRLANLEVGRIDVGGFAVNSATLAGTVSSAGFDIAVTSDEVVGTLTQSGETPLLVALQAVNAPGGDSAEGEASEDPVGPELIAELPAADVSIERLQLGEQDYGTWRFKLRPQGADLRVEEIAASVRGVVLASSEALLWRGEANETRFTGSFDGGNLADVLPQWGYAANVETETATLTGAFSWTGSPLAVDLLKLRGTAAARATEGRFLEVESGAGAQRIFSLLNFTAIAKRMALNFGDVFGRGVSFDELNAEIGLNEGQLEFVEPMEVTGTGSRFRVTGRVDMKTGVLNNDMIVTLPVSQSLPWYAAYVALANPLVGLGVLVGERVLRKPLEQFSSARYRIGGTLDNPDVKFVSVFDVSSPASVEEAGDPDAPAVTGGPDGDAEQKDVSDDE
ncbi:MAG: AsmA-like C-terminal region-containing protein [Pseudomonadales bacterium]